MSEAILGTAGAIEIAEAMVKKAGGGRGLRAAAKGPADWQALAVGEGQTQTRELARAAGRKKHMAMEALRGGSSFAQAAQAAGVSRSTIYRWVQSNAQFRAVYNAWQQEMLESSRARLVALTDQAVDAVASALRRRDEKIALGMLKHLGAMRQPHTGSTDPQVAQLQLDLQKKREEHKALQAMAEHLLERAGSTPAERRHYLSETALPQLGEELSARKLLGCEPQENQTDHETTEIGGQPVAEEIGDKPSPQQKIERPSTESAAVRPSEARRAVSHDLSPLENSQVSADKGDASE